MEISCICRQKQCCKNAVHGRRCDCAVLAGRAFSEIKVIAANAIKEGYSELVSAFQKSSGHKVITTWTGTVNATKRINDGEVYDLVIVGSDNIDQLIRSEKLTLAVAPILQKPGLVRQFGLTCRNQIFRAATQ